MVVLIITTILFAFLWLVAKGKSAKDLKGLNQQLQATQSERNVLAEKAKALELKNEELSKYQAIIDAEQRAREVLADAKSNASQLISDANMELTNAKAEASQIKRIAKQDAEEIKIKSAEIIANANKHAEEIVDTANKRAEEIAGDAYEAMKNAKEFEKTAKAMRNIVEGYGDQYLVPTYSLLDDLAEEFGHTEAGENLKAAREKTISLMKYDRAAKCEYVEAVRKESAINFVLDAFNGKVDSILSKVKKDNYGTLEQKIKDAFQIVNHNGKAFKNAVITKEYLEARIDELKWAVIAQELKWEEKEEQRRIKAQIREEEKAKRDYERAIKEAQKEEETLKRLIEKAQKQAAQANEGQKAQYEEKLRELEERLKGAEEKNQRAVSMAQQTKSGNVYIISNIGSFGENVYKIGMTRRLEPLDRIKELGDASVPFEFDVHSMIYCEDAPGLERELHKKFLRLQLNKVNPRKEFFKIGLKDIKEEIEKMGISAKWTMMAEAREYRESLTIEKDIETDKEKQAQWLKHQLELDPVGLEVEEEAEAI